jgi:hypothetical protein
MVLNPYLAQQLKEERVKDALRNAEQTRLIQAAKDPRKSQGWWLAALLRNRLSANGQPNVGQISGKGRQVVIE